MSSTEQDQKEQDKRLEENLGRIKNTIAVLSGKGGVGKSTVAVNMAFALAMEGYEVGILDVDIHGPNIAKMLGIEGNLLKGGSEGIEPYPVLPNLKAVSLALLVKEQYSPIIWRGPLKIGTIKQFLADTAWGELDYLIIDTPPGTGDESLTICQLIPGINGAVIVTTPQDVAILDSRRTVNFAEKVDVPVIGIIENMSGFVCPHCGTETALFKKGGGEKAAAECKVPFLGSIPIEPDITEMSDGGTPYIRNKNSTPTVKRMQEIVSTIAAYRRA